MRLMKRIGREYSTSQLAEMVVSRGPTDRELAEEELFDLVFNDPSLSEIIAYHNATRSDIVEIYRRLSALGLTWIRESYVPAAAIALKPTLIYLLKTINNPLPENWSDFDRWIRIVNDLTQYFKSGRLGAV